MNDDAISAMLPVAPTTSASAGGRAAAFARRRLGIGTALWRRHPGVRPPEHLTPGERAADRLRNGMGSWAFVFGALLFLAAWMAVNGRHGFDPYPFILLNLLLSCLAAMQGAILLIAARRSDQIASELALHDYETDRGAAAMLEQVLTELAELRAAMNERPLPGPEAAPSASQPE